MTSIQEDVHALRTMAAGLGLQPVAAPASMKCSPPPDPHWIEATLARVTSGHGSPAAVADPPIRPRPTQRTRHVYGVIGIAACIALLAVVVGIAAYRPAPASAVPPVLSFSRVDPRALGPDSGVPAKLQLLGIAAAARASHDDPRPPGSETQHVRTDEWRLETEVTDRVAVKIRPTHRDSWLGADGRRRLRETPTAPQFDENGRQVERGESGETVTDTVSHDVFNLPRNLPHDPSRLADILLRGTPAEGGADTATQTLALASRIADIFDTRVVDSDVRAALWTVLSKREAVRDLGATLDRAGRPGRAFSIWDADTLALEIWIIDTTTGSLLGREAVMFGYAGVVTDQVPRAPWIGWQVTYLGATWEK